MTVHRLGGTVEGAPTARINFLQRIDELVAMEAAFAPYLKDGETPIERLERERRDNDALLTLLAKEKARAEAAEATVQQLRGGARRSAEGRS